MKNIVFKKAGRILDHSEPFEVIASADMIIITFEYQKNDWRDYKVHMFNTDDALLSPVQAGARIIK